MVFSSNASSSAQPPAPILYRYDLRQIDPLAVCQDGTPAYVYVSNPNGGSRGQESQLSAGHPREKQMFLLYLEGGYWCFDLQTCEDRVVQFFRYASSKNWPDKVTAQGLLGQYDYAEVVYVYYCTSDAHVANSTIKRASGSQPAEWQFRGRVVIDAAMKYLRMRGLGVHGEGKSLHDSGFSGGGDQKLVFAGGSSGARGAMWLYDDVRQNFPGVEVLGVFDSPLWTQQPIFANDFLFGVALDLQKSYSGHLVHVSLRENVKLFAKTFADSLTPSIFDQECLKHFRSDESWKCLLGEYRLPFVKPPYFISASQYDEFFLSYSMGGPLLVLSPTAAAQAYRENYRFEIRKSLASARGSVYSSACYRHVLSSSNDYYTSTAECPALSSAVDQFLRKPHRKVGYISDCEGFDCDCPGDFKYPIAIFGLVLIVSISILYRFFLWVCRRRATGSLHEPLLDK